MGDIRLDFDGPYTFTDEGDSVFRCLHAKAAGIYLWTVKQREDRAHLIHYIGETSRLAQRHREHLIQILGLNYGIFDIQDAREGVCTLRWKGLWRDKTADGPSRLLSEYQGIADSVISYVRGIEIFFALLDGKADVRKHVEGCIGYHLRSIRPEWSRIYPSDNQVGRMSGPKNGLLRITAKEEIRGLDATIGL